MLKEKIEVVYLYDGSFEGFLSCVYENYYSNYTPVNIVYDVLYQPSFYDTIYIKTNEVNYKKVSDAIKNKISKFTLNFLRDCFLCEGENIEMQMLDFIINLFKSGFSVYNNYNINSTVALRKLHKNITREAHLYLGIVRFQKINNTYVSRIEPNNRILYKIANHFKTRNLDLPFVIYDENHKELLMGTREKTKIIQVDNLEIPSITKEEENLEKLWTKYYDTISIKERYNPRCRDNFIPKYRHKHMTELK